MTTAFDIIRANWKDGFLILVLKCDGGKPTEHRFGRYFPPLGKPSAEEFLMRPDKRKEVASELRCEQSILDDAVYRYFGRL